MLHEGLSVGDDCVCLPLGDARLGGVGDDGGCLFGRNPDFRGIRENRVCLHLGDAHLGRVGDDGVC